MAYRGMICRNCGAQLEDPVMIEERPLDQVLEPREPVDNRPLFMFLGNAATVALVMTDRELLKEMWGMVKATKRRVEFLEDRVEVLESLLRSEVESLTKATGQLGDIMKQIDNLTSIVANLTLAVSQHGPMQ